MKRLGLRFPNWTRVLFSLTFLLSLTSGLLWFGLDRWGDVEGEFGPQKHPWISFLPKVHGASAFLALIFIGMIFGAHVPIGWRTHRRRLSGICMIALLALLVISAWGLYYGGDDEVRRQIILVHLGSGLLLPATLVWHLLERRGQHKR